MAASLSAGTSVIAFLLLAGLSLLAWVSTYTGILELIEASSGDVGLAARVAIGFAVLMLQLMILYILDALFSRAFYQKDFRFRKFSLVLAPLYVIGYAILFAISVGFAFGFYWKYLEAGSETTKTAEASITRVQEDLQLGQSRLEQLQTTFTSLRLTSAEKAETERSSGRTCPASGPGDGPRRRLRDADAERFASAADFIAARTATVKADIAELNTELSKIIRKDPSTIDPATGSRNQFISQLNQKLGLTVTRFNALKTDPQLLQMRDEFRIRAGKTTFPDDRGGTFTCPDPALTSELNGVVRAIDELPVLEKQEVRAFEGSEAVLEAFRRLTNSGVGWARDVRAAFTGETPPPVEDGLSDRDLIPLIIAIFVDVCILLVSINRPFGFVFDMTQSMKDARRSGANRYLIPFFEVFQGVFDKDNPPTPQQQLNPLEDVILDHEGEYYAAVPLDFRDPDHIERRDAVLRKMQNRDDTDWFDPSSDLPLETSRYISNVYLALEGRGVVSLLKGSEWPQGLRENDSVRRKLAEQGSVYAQANAFRLYQIERRRWSQFVQSVVGSGADSEERLAARRARAAARDDGRPRFQLPGFGRATPALTGAAAGGGAVNRGDLTDRQPAEPPAIPRPAQPILEDKRAPDGDDFNQDVNGGDEFSGIDGKFKPKPN
ncbi:MAG: hypothetical protein NW215_05210 [Hyphomicrobiales bacterium]|nr:hypothetical protein [Hyphomicrobiales bacterium]